MKPNKWQKNTEDEDDDHVLSNFFQQNMQEQQFVDKLLDSFIEVSLWGLTVTFIAVAAVTEYNAVALLSILTAWTAVFYKKYLVNRGEY